MNGAHHLARPTQFGMRSSKIAASVVGGLLIVQAFVSRRADSSFRNPSSEKCNFTSFRNPASEEGNFASDHARLLSERLLTP